MWGAYNSADLRKYKIIPPNSRLTEDKVLKGDYYKILSACAHVHRNSPIAEAIMQSMLGYIAPSGLTPIGPSQSCINVWNNWAFDADLSGIKNLDAIYHELVREQIMGDVLVILPAIATVYDEVSVRLELIPGGRVKNPDNIPDGDKNEFGHYCMHGVAYDSQGVEVGYYVHRPDAEHKVTYISKVAPDTGRLRAFLSRRPGQTRAGQTRSLPMIAPALQAIYDVDAITVHVLERTKNQAKIGVFISSGRPADTAAGLGAADPTTGALRTDASGELTADYAIQPAVEDWVNILPPDSKVESATIAGGVELGEVYKSVFLPIAASMNIPLPILLASYADINFSAGKLASQNLQRFVEFWNTQNGHLFTLIWRTVMTEALALGLIDELKPTDLNPTWIGSKGIGETNRTDTAKAVQLALQNGTTTVSGEVAREGHSFESLIRQKAQEIQIINAVAAEFGISPDQLRSAMAPTAPTTETPEAA